ncbi:hypothetical protein [Nevskia sp.]|uniref:hypothetical protein n=1 Tax=Nevskia sp. TaxID=1929292 RepID=UPI0025D5B10F|nr:hypothetical protein [Nevskia sp.]
MRFAFRRRYNLAPTDPRYLSATDEDIAADEAAWDAYLNKGELLTTDNFAAEVAEMMEQAKHDNPDDFEDVP